MTILLAGLIGLGVSLSYQLGLNATADKKEKVETVKEEKRDVASEKTNDSK